MKLFSQKRDNIWGTMGRIQKKAESLTKDMGLCKNQDSCFE